MPSNLQEFSFRGLNNGRLFCVVAPNFSVALVLALESMRDAVYAGLSGSLPGVYWHPCAVLTVLEVRRLATAYPVYETMGGPLPLTGFDPYGMAPADGDVPAGGTGDRR